MKTESCPILRVGDIKVKLIERFGNEVSFSSAKSNTKRQIKQEYIIPSGESLPSEVITAAYHG